MKYKTLNIMFTPENCKMEFADGDPFTQEFRHAVKTHLTSLRGLKRFLEEKYDVEYLIGGDVNGQAVYEDADREEIKECAKLHNEGVIGIRMATSTLMAKAVETLLKGA